MINPGLSSGQLRADRVPRADSSIKMNHLHIDGISGTGCVVTLVASFTTALHQSDFLFILTCCTGLSTIAYNALRTYKEWKRKN